MPAGQLPSAARTAQIAWTRASTSAKRCSDEAFAGIVSDMSRRLTQFRGRVKKPLMLDQRETVGHPCDEITDPPGPRALGLALGPLQPFRRQVRRALLVAREQ